MKTKEQVLTLASIVEKETALPVIPPLTKVKVRILVDDDEKAVRSLWEERLRKRVLKRALGHPMAPPEEETEITPLIRSGTGKR